MMDKDHKWRDELSSPTDSKTSFVKVSTFSAVAGKKSCVVGVPILHSVRCCRLIAHFPKDKGHFKASLAESPIYSTVSKH